MQCTFGSKSDENDQRLFLCEEIVQEEELKNELVKIKISYAYVVGPPSQAVLFLVASCGS